MALYAHVFTTRQVPTIKKKKNDCVFLVFLALLECFHLLLSNLFNAGALVQVLYCMLHNVSNADAAMAINSILHFSGAKLYTPVFFVSHCVCLFLHPPHQHFNFIWAWEMGGGGRASLIINLINYYSLTQ